MEFKPIPLSANEKWKCEMALSNAADALSNLSSFTDRDLLTFISYESMTRQRKVLLKRLIGRYHKLKRLETIARVNSFMEDYNAGKRHRKVS